MLLDDLWRAIDRANLCVYTQRIDRPATQRIMRQYFALRPCHTTWYPSFRSAPNPSRRLTRPRCPCSSGYGSRTRTVCAHNKPIGWRRATRGHVIPGRAYHVTRSAAAHARDTRRSRYVTSRSWLRHAVLIAAAASAVVRYRVVRDGDVNDHLPAPTRICITCMRLASSKRHIWLNEGLLLQQQLLLLRW